MKTVHRRLTGEMMDNLDWVSEGDYFMGPCGERKGMVVQKDQNGFTVKNRSVAHPWHIPGSHPSVESRTYRIGEDKRLMVNSWSESVRGISKCYEEDDRQLVVGGII